MSAPHSRRPQASTIVVLFLHLLSSVQALFVTPSSPCLSQCASASVGTTDADVVCLDTAYSSSSNTSHFQQCVECELGSNAVDAATGMTDVMWGLYNLRYTVSSCIFGFPAPVPSVDTPCFQTCKILSAALEQGITPNATKADMSFCNQANFTDAAINQCVFCYGLSGEQVYLANFLQTIHIACRDPPSATNPLPVAPSAIFNETVIAAPIVSPSAAHPHGLSGADLGVAIALPLVFVLLLIIGGCAGCYFLTRRRQRQHLIAEENALRYHDNWGDSPDTPRAGMFAFEQPISMGHILDASSPTDRFAEAGGPHALNAPDQHHVGLGLDQKRDPHLREHYLNEPLSALSTQGVAAGPHDTKLRDEAQRDTFYSTREAADFPPRQ